MGSELDYGVIIGMEWCMEFRIDRVCLELEFRNIPEMDSEMDYGVVIGVGGRTEFCSDGIWSELWFGNIPELVAEIYVPLQDLKGSI